MNEANHRVRLIASSTHGSAAPAVPDDSPIVEFMVNNGLADRLLAEHVDDGTGRCRVCSDGAQRGHHTWPCRICDYATRAREVERRAADRAVRRTRRQP